MILSSSVGDGGGVSIEIVIVISAVVAAVVVMGVGVIGLQGAALLLVMFMLSTTGVFGSSASFGGSFGFPGVAVLFLLSRSHKSLSRRRCYG